MSELYHEIPLQEGLDFDFVPCFAIESTGGFPEIHTQGLLEERYLTERGLGTLGLD